MTAEKLKKFIVAVPDFPKKGILFRDITPLLANPEALASAIELLAEKYSGEGIHKVLGAESRGFLLAAPVALRLHAGVVPVRKKGRLPRSAVAAEYSLEYGNDTLEIHTDAITKGEKVLIVDDVLATGGTLFAVSRMVEKLEGVIAGIAVLIELESLNGRARLSNYACDSLIKY